jgi:hypothetical protein
MSKRIKSSISELVVTRHLQDIAKEAGIKEPDVTNRKLRGYKSQRVKPDNDSRLDKVMLQSLFNVFTMESKE